MVTDTSNIMEDAQQLPWSGLRFGASPALLVLLVPVAAAGVIGGLIGGPLAALISASVAVAVSAVIVAAGAVSRAETAAASGDQQIRLERALSTASRALLKRDVADPVGTALGALIDGVDVAAVFLETVSQDPHDEHGNKMSVRDILYREDPDGRPGRWELTGWRIGQLAQSALRDGLEHETVISSLDQLTVAFYRAAQVGAEVLLPISVEGKWVGNLGFISTSRDRQWSADEKRLLRATADMIGSYWERRDARAKLEELIAAKDEFIASVSHEVRTPLTAVLGFASELDENADKFSDDERAELVSLLAAQSREVANIVDDLLTAARAEAGTLVISADTLSVQSLIGEVLASHSGRVDFSACDDIEAWADSGRVRQILRNLLTNADRYGGDIVKISVRRAADAMVRIEVRDNGEGIPRHLHDQVFEPYGRGRNSATQPASVGLGLSVARQLATMMHGSLTLSEEDGWTVFSLQLPSAQPADLVSALR